MNLLHDSYLLKGGILTIVLQLFFFFIAYTFQIDLLTDFGGSSNFVILAILSYLQTKHHPLRSTIITACVIVWGLRLGFFLFYRIVHTGKDDRFDTMRSDFKRFSKFWIAQMVWVYIVSLPCVLTNAKLYKNQSKFGNPLDIIGLTFFVVGLLVEIIADYQRFQFIFQRQSKLQVLNSGLWYYSRHPNYFGEIMLWWGIFIISLSSSPYFYIGILSPILTMFLLLKLSGIPKSEPQKDQLIQSKGTEEQKKEYENYLNRTSPLIMLPPSVYQNIPLDLKQKFFFELKSYRFNRDSEPLLNSQQGE